MSDVSDEDWRRRFDCRWCLTHHSVTPCLNREHEQRCPMRPSEDR